LFQGDLSDTIVNVSFFAYDADSSVRIHKYAKEFRDWEYNFHLLMGEDTVFYCKEGREIP